MATASPPRPPRRRGDVGGALLDAAEAEFASHGFEGASTRRIAERAGAHQPQINYHFGSKGQLWQRVVDRLFAELDEEVLAHLALAPPGPSAALSATVDGFIAFSARRPELNRIINLEATTTTGRLAWLVEEHIAPRRAAVGGLWSEVRGAGEGADLSGDDLWDLVTSFGALHFANAPMVALVSESGPDGPAAHAAKLKTLLGIVGPG